MKIEVNVNENLVESMYNKYCNTIECVDCKCNILPNEKYINCYEKYKKEYFKYDIQDKINRMLKIIE